MAKANRAKHGITFDEAATVFDDFLIRITRQTKIATLPSGDPVRTGCS